MALDISSLAATYVSTILALMIIVTRLIGQHTRGGKLQKEDIWMGAAAIPLLIRLGAEHVVLDFGTNLFADLANLSQREIERRIIGSKLVLVCRVSTVCFLWTLKLCMLGFYEKLASGRSLYHYMIKACRWVVGLTFIAAVLSTFLECRPFYVYWEITPDRGDHCTDANIQLLIMGICNILTDIALIMIPLPLICRSRLPNIRKAQLTVLFSLGIFVMTITIIRMPLLYRAKSQQPDRTMWISIECVAACLAANAPIIYSFTRHKQANDTERCCAVDTAPTRKNSVDSDDDLLWETAAYGGCYLIETKMEFVEGFVDVDPRGV